MDKVELIDRAALIEAFKMQYGCETCDNYDGVRCRACHCDDALGIIDMAPTIDAAPVRRGEWKCQMDIKECLPAECSVCGMLRDIYTQCGWNFCPHCGADMRRSDDGKIN